MWSTIGIAYKLALARGANSSWLILGRPLIGAVISITLILAGRGRPSKWSLLIGACALGPLFVLYLEAIQYIGASLAAILLYTAPIWVVLLSPLLKEHASPIAWISSIIGFIGVILVSLKSIRLGEIWGLMLGLGSGLSYALYMLLARLASRRGASTLEIGLHSQLFATAEVALIVHPTALPSKQDSIWLVYLGIFTMAIPYVLHVKALSMAKAYRVAVISLLEPLGAIFLAHIILGETLSLLQLLGAFMILLAAALITTKQ